MKFYLQTISGVPTGNALLEFDLKRKFPEHDFSIPPSGYVEYFPTQLERKLNSFETLEVESYFMRPDGSASDIIKVRSLTPEEKEKKIDSMKRAFISRTGYKSWNYNELLDIFQAPFQPQNPVNGAKYVWDETNQKWDRID